MDLLKFTNDVNRILYKLEMFINRLFKNVFTNVTTSHRTRLIDLYTFSEGKVGLIWTCIINDRYYDDKPYKTYLNFDIRYKQ